MMKNKMKINYPVVRLILRAIMLLSFLSAYIYAGYKGYMFIFGMLNFSYIIYFFLHVDGFSIESRQQLQDEKFYRMYLKNKEKCK